MAGLLNAVRRMRRFDETSDRQGTSLSCFEEFRSASYANRYEELLVRLLRERLYDRTCFLMSDRKKGVSGEFTEPASDLSFQLFVSSLLAKINGDIKGV